MGDLASIASGDWASLCALVFLLGLRHGFDADHLAAIDGLSRLATRQGGAHARFCGALFSLGHGAVVLLIAGLVGVMSEHWATPAWLELFGAWVSIAFLLLLGVLNLWAVLSTPSHQRVALQGLKSGLLLRWLPASSGGKPWGSALVGALFALSFDTVSQSALFAVMAAQFGGLAHALSLGLLFVLGMVVADGLNGWWIAHLIARADQIAALASRIMSLAVAALSLAVAGLGLAKLASPALQAWMEGKELGLAALLLLGLALSYGLALRLSRQLSRQLGGAASPGAAPR
ncbi:nickel transporter [Paucibacter sp. KBW04]|uniref:HoxN/HupN/NixA family nickel/cobalt transporter n=1 Tax=Paucibacter sp. KBW04 TaxID=2153361 RepID=UPI000F567CAA|nr:nickel transporter [Paucibacter sp. KBW04]RQO55388.1 nickel transporter [Paucibacter sp. KBW04]